jgi:hypothetical protein
MDEHDTQDGPVRPLILAPLERAKGVSQARWSELMADLPSYEGLIELHDPKAASPVMIERAIGRRFDA